MNQEQPINELEKMMMAAHAGTVHVHAVLDLLGRSKIAVLMDQKIAAAPPGAQLTPLVLQDKDGHFALIAFTAKERAAAQAWRFPEFPVVELVDAGWMLQGVQDHVGLALNPASAWGIGLPADGLKQWKEDRLRREKRRP
jgi:hypothetical protein